MKQVFRKIRFYSWFGKSLVERYWRAFISSFIVGLLLVLLTIRIYPAFSTVLFRKHKIIGLVGSFTPTTLPLPIQNLLSVGLVGVTSTGEPIPALASSWEATDSGKRYIFHLKDNVYWHDGKKLKAEDINYNLRDVEFNSIDDLTLEVILKEPFSPLPIFLSKPLFKQGLVGVGSYRLGAIKLHGDKVSYIRLLPFKKDSGFLPVTIRFYPTEEKAKLGFILGEVNTIDEILDPNPFVNWSQVSIKETIKYNQYIGLFFNTEDQLLGEKNMRQALSFSLGKPEGNPVYTPLSSKSWAYNSKVKRYDVDIAVAEKLFSRVISSTDSAEITLSTFHRYLDYAHEIAQSWEKIEGLRVRVKLEDRTPDDFQVLLASQEIPPDPDQYPFWHSTQGSTNITRYKNPKIDKLLEDGRREFDLEKRKRIYHEFQRNLVEDAPAAFLYHPTVYTISRE